MPPSLPTPTQPAESTLKLTPNEIHTYAGQNNTINIQLNTQGKNPTLLQIELAYDPTILTEIEITPITNSKILLKNIDEKTGRISYAINLPPDFSSSKIPATLTFKIKKDPQQNQTTLYFLPKTTVLAKGINIPIKIAYGAKIFITIP